MSKRGWRAALAALVLGLHAAVASAQGWPSKPVRIIVPYSVGGSSDFVARTLAAKLTEGLGQPFVAESRTGAGGNIATDFVAKSDPDGHTLLLATDGPIVINPGLYASLPFDIGRDLRPVTLATATSFVLLAAPGFPPSSVQELIALAKANPGKFNFASLGIGSEAHLAGERLNMDAGVRLVHVPYKGFSPAATDVMSGKVEILFGSVPPSVPLVRGGRLKALAVTSGRRQPALPDVPTMAEAGLRDFELYAWFGLMAPARTPQAVVERLHAEASKALQSKDVVDRFAAQGMDVLNAGPQEFGARIAADLKMWSAIIKASGAKAE